MSPDEIAPSHDPNVAQAEMERSRDSAARLMESLARKIGSARAMRDATAGIERAARYVQVHSVKDVVTGLERLVRRRPVYSIGAAVAAGFLIGRWIRSR